MANSTNNLVIVPLGDLDAGTYGPPDDLLRVVTGSLLLGTA